MVFTSLGANEKEAFFNLLDEYFTSRPELLSSLGTSSSGAEVASSTSGSGLNSRAASSAVHSALVANPEATAHLISSGLRHGAQNSSVKNSPFTNAASEPGVSNSIGRVAAASLAFGQRNMPKSSPPAVRNTPPPPPATRTMPPTLPRRTSSAEQEDEGSSPPIRAPVATRSAGSPAGLVPDNSSSFSLRKNANKSPSVVLPSAFPKRQNNFAPPPVRRPTSSSQQSPSPEPEQEQEQEDQGDWVEALYDYNSGEAGDLMLSAHQRIKVVSKDSDDWWSGEVDGRTGLFPASYVKSL
ncbi:hypothetical protein EW145_g758 [Phellinidium pouzarii]|uniref:SH3 domain-containing protein n=1 Tax=Phellinidium pouzarii TaxID=167371 RepID=A0A4S4LHA5_9AGAM|nr:hypothetical protein EW145_g758 [Phellinidium pouzarii]